MNIVCKESQSSDNDKPTEVDVRRTSKYVGLELSYTYYGEAFLTPSEARRVACALLMAAEETDNV